MHHAVAEMIEVARANLGKGPCSTNSAGGHGYYSSWPGAGGALEPWCALFVKWVWAQAGANVDGLTSAAGGFARYGELETSPQVGDAVVYDYCCEGPGTARHVAIVVAVDGGNITTIGVDETGDDWAASSHVAQDGPYPAALGPSSYVGMPISGYVSPRIPPPRAAPPFWISTRMLAPGQQENPAVPGSAPMYSKNCTPRLAGLLPFSQ